MGRYSRKIQSEQETISKVTFSFIEGQYAGGKFFLPLSKMFVIGRDVTSDVAVVETKVSRKHAKLWEQDGHVFIEDLGSTNGTLLNGSRLDKNIPVSLRKDDTLTVGDTVFILNTELSNISHSGDESIIILGHSAPAPSVEMEEGELIIEGEEEEISILSSSDAIMSELLQENDDEPSITKTDMITDPSDDYSDLLDEEDDDLMLSDSSGIIGDLISEVSQVQTSPQVLGKVGLSQTASHLAQTHKPLLSLNRGGETKGNLQEFTIDELLGFLAQTSIAGILTLKISAPFNEVMRVDIAGKGLSAASSLSHQNFGDEKSLTRIMLARAANWSFLASIEAQAFKVNKYLDDIQMEISGTQDLLIRYRKLIRASQLKFAIPMTGKLSDLTSNDLETIQMMVNTREVCLYLDLFPDLDDFILLNEVIKYIDLGILFGDNNDEG